VLFASLLAGSVARAGTDIPMAKLTMAMPNDCNFMAQLYAQKGDARFQYVKTSGAS
jgi:hypothetical protein